MHLIQYIPIGSWLIWLACNTILQLRFSYPGLNVQDPENSIRRWRLNTSSQQSFNYFRCGFHSGCFDLILSNSVNHILFTILNFYQNVNKISDGLFFRESVGRMELQPLTCHVLIKPIQMIAFAMFGVFWYVQFDYFINHIRT